MLEIKPLKTGSDGNLYIINCNNIFYLLECGIKKEDIIKTLYIEKHLISDFKGCFISHKHSDHCKGLSEIIKYMPVYSNRQLITDMKLDGEILKPKMIYDFKGNLKVMAFNVEHGNAENYAYMFKNENYKILFMTDVFKFDEILNSAFDEIFIECNWTKELMINALEETKDTQKYTKFERQYQTHCSLDNLKLILENSINLTNCKKITLIHASKEVCDKELALKELKSLYPNISIAFAENII